MAATTRIYEDTYTGGQFVTGFTLTNAGTGYSGIPAVTIASPTVGGEDATGTAVLDATGLLPLDSITLDNAGSGYIAAPTVTVDAPLSGVTATATAGVSTGDTNTYEGSTIALVDFNAHAVAHTIDASTMLGGSNGTEGFQKYIITALEWSLSHSVAITFTGTGVTGATHLAAGSGKYSSTAITNAATQPGTAANADIVLTPGASCSGFVLLYLQKGAFV
jgi:hypothetical protein